jgi:hypothetical protein
MEECVLVGDSLNDCEAAKHNDIAFKGVYNDEVRKLSDITLF